MDGLTVDLGDVPKLRHEVLEPLEALLADLVQARREPVGALPRVGRASRRCVRAFDDALFRLRDRLTGCIGCGCLSMKACYLLNPNDELAEEGPGARRIT